MMRTVKESLLAAGLVIAVVFVLFWSRPAISDEGVEGAAEPPKTVPDAIETHESEEEPKATFRLELDFNGGILEEAEARAHEAATHARAQAERVAKVARETQERIRAKISAHQQHVRELHAKRMREAQERTARRSSADREEHDREEHGREQHAEIADPELHRLMERREHLNAAATHLIMAGMPDMAVEVQQRGQQLEHEIQAIRQHREREEMHRRQREEAEQRERAERERAKHQGDGGPEVRGDLRELHSLVRELHEQIGQLRRDVNELRESKDRQE